MKITKLIKGGLFIYECIRVVLIAFVLYLQGIGGLSVKVIYTAPCALYPLMALFIMIGANRYKVYVPLFIAGKCIGVFMLLGWSIITRQVTMIESFILSGDFFSLAAALMINRDFRKQTEFNEQKQPAELPSSPEPEDK